MEKLNKLEKLTRLTADGHHNAFTSLARFGDHIYLTYRTSGGHASTDGRVVLLRSPDNGENWVPLPSPFSAGRNYYEGFLVEFNGRLFMYAGAFEADRPVSEQLSSTYVSYSDDGVAWTEPLPAGEPQWRFWHPRAIDGLLYAARYRLTTRQHLQDDGTFPPEDWEVDLVASANGLNWDKVSEISRGDSGNETELHWDGKMLTAFIRRENCPCTLAIRQSPPPFTEWGPITDFGECVQGMAVGKCGDRLFMFGRRRESSPDIGTIYYDRAKISVRGYVFLPDPGRWFEYLRLPGAHDCSYPEILELPGNRMLVSYYSQHEYDNPDINSAADIYLAVIRGDGTPEMNPRTAAMLRKKGIL